MSVRVWLPLNGDLRNQGLDYEYQSSSTNYIINNNGKIGKCILTTNLIDTTVPSSVWDFTTKNISFGGWIKINKQQLLTKIGTKDYTSTYFSCGGTVFGYDSYGGLSIRWQTNNIYQNQQLTNVNIFIHLRNSSSQTVQSGTYTIPFDTWTHVFCIFDRTHSRFYLYINGILNKTNSFTPSAFESGNIRQGNFCISKAEWHGGNGFAISGPWYINDVRIYDHALSEFEIKRISQGLILHYPLDNRGLGNVNLAYNTKNLSPGASSQVEYKAYKVGLLDVTDGETVTVSFDLDMTISTANNYLLVYNSNKKGPHRIQSVLALPNESVSVGDHIQKRDRILFKL